jgi:hypothetical protein
MYKPRVEHVLGMGTRTQDFNCWGATMFIAHGSDHLEWVEHNAMGEWLKANYTPIKRKDVAEGDIVALFDEEKHLIHTAYALGEGKYVHKVGQNVARLEPLQRVLRTYARELHGFVFLRSKSCV